jgi:hypothetical protein
MYLTCDISKPTAINYSNPSPAPAEASSSNIKQTRKSPYNTRPPKKPSLPTPEENLSADTISSTTPPSQILGKLPSLTEIGPLLKKRMLLPK